MNQNRFPPPGPARTNNSTNLAGPSHQSQRPHDRNPRQDYRHQQSKFFLMPNFESSGSYTEKFGGGRWNSSRGSRGGGRRRGGGGGGRGNGQSSNGYSNPVGGRGRGGRGCKKQDSRQLQQRPEKKHNFYCCSCERGFKTQELMDQHNKEHIVCGLDGCQFQAHSLVVSKHIRMQHEGNLYQRMKNLNTPEDIERWKEERRKNYPTANKVQQKDDERKEKIERREICGLANRKTTQSAQPTFSGFRYKIQKHDARTKSFLDYERNLRRLEYEQSAEWMRRPFAPNRDIPHVRVPFFSMNKSKVVCLENFYMNVKMGKDGKLQKQTKVKWKSVNAKQLDRLTDSESETEDAAIPISDSSDDDEGEDDSGNCLNTEVVRVTEQQSTAKSSNEGEGEQMPNKPATNFMLVNYSSASESGDETDICNETEGSDPKAGTNAADQVLQSPVVGTSTGGKTTSRGPDAIVSETCSKQKHVQRDSSGSNDRIVIEEFKKRSAFKDIRILRKPSYKSRKEWMRTKLLETLLQDQIRKERNILLQTCRFVRENNFFGHN